MNITIETMVEREVLACCSGLICDLINHQSEYPHSNNCWVDLEEQENLTITDNACIKLYESYGYEPDIDLTDNMKITHIREHGEDYQDALEYWLVSKWFYDKLMAQGEIGLNNGQNYFWGRQTSGQAISIDSVIETIYKELVK